MRCLVIGGDGFLGSHMVDALLKHGYDVSVFDRFLNGDSKNLNHLDAHSVQRISGDFLRKEDIKNALQNVDFVFHFLSLTTPASSASDPLIDIEANLIGTVQLLKLCVEHGIKRVIFPSSGGTVYGNQNSSGLLAENFPTLPISPYGICKVAIENYLEYFRLNYGLDYLIFRYSNPYGIRQNPKGKQGVIPIFLRKILNDEQILIFGDGESVRDYIYVEDCIKYSLALFLLKECPYRIFNIGSGVGVSVNSVLNMMKDVTGKTLDVKHENARLYDVRGSILDLNRLSQVVGLQPTKDLHSGIEIVWKEMLKVNNV